MTLCSEHSMPFCRECTKATDDRIEIPGSTLKMRPPKVKERKPLKRSAKTTDRSMCSNPRHIRQGDYLSMVGQAKASQNGRCVGHRAGIDHDCTDPFDFAHLVKQQSIVREHGEGHPALTDPRLGVYACRFIHSSFDGWSGELRDPVTRMALVAQAHPDLDAALDEYGLRAYFDREVMGA